MPEQIPVIVKVKRAANFPQFVMEVPENCLNDIIKLGAKATVYRDGNKLIYQFGEIHG